MTIPASGAIVPAIRGWTLVELLATGSILMILACTAVPALDGWLQSAADRAAFHRLNRAAVAGRTQAIRQQRYVTVCGSSDNVHCSGQWNDNVIVFSDANRNETVDSGDQLYRAFVVDDNAPCVHWRGGAHRNYLQFKPSGASNGTAGHFAPCDSQRRSPRYRLVVSLNGRTALRFQ